MKAAKNILASFIDAHPSGSETIAKRYTSSDGYFAGGRGGSRRYSYGRGRGGVRGILVVE